MVRTALDISATHSGCQGDSPWRPILDNWATRPGYQGDPPNPPRISGRPALDIGGEQCFLQWKTVGFLPTVCDDDDDADNDDDDIVASVVL